MIRGRGRTDWGLQAVLAAMTIVLIIQNTKQALLPAKQEPALWAAEGVAIACWLVLRSGWARDGEWAKEQEELGTLANNYYEPRRDALLNGSVIALGVIGSLWWALATWGAVFYGMRRGQPGRGLPSFAAGAFMGAMTGGMIGAVAGLGVGHAWEKRHRRQRMERRLSNA
jgi:hypothetical protein